MNSGLNMASIIDRVPFDIWITIYSHLTVQCILTLGYVCGFQALSPGFTLDFYTDSQTCKFFFSIMQERSIWSTVLGDILDVVALRTVRDAMPSMSSQDLRNTAVRAMRIDQLFNNNDVIRPVKVKHIPCSQDAAKIQLTFGGQWILIMYDNGSLNLYHTRDFESPLVSLARPDGSPPLHWNESYMEVQITSLHEEHLVVVSEDFNSVE
jgi:hypothetical protein